MNKVIAGLLGVVGLAIAASSSGAVAAPVLTDGARVETVQYAYGYRPAYRPGFHRDYRHFRRHGFYRGHAFGRFHGRRHFAGRYHR